MAKTQTHAARSLDEQFVAYFEYDEGCVKTTEGVIPPPTNCSETVQTLYGIASWHLFSAIVAAAFLGMMISLTMSVFAKDGGH
ncbi:hypothetical protein A2348_02865 [Candidatus Uhrbacteria bacterium RIFOXYB12_FULL_58_10]|uniref:Uncharacterized protein n=1 Tax=Candidatus Uhrbacteria bacterium RIFOXYB2_FULL_57_15 TaxID=1802422 RepID=A0A1F7W6P6_9BACT|nr:MAG: hypothetical protein A2348_02865 [Candidatus Uhrbacteria bacterium RIFOXYB12_FULL_58_10]OGL98449.1 MAG: hypothetical protein A2304_02025 [Candidatus Uhrbacteria bacterium RIFOXYB2_FULL_57_15]OGL99236.1 MAG: hypothetical protein A2501_03510 [Candidatus Uhrbacteria bacterium RIFOXYC12_FULL_57_11]